MHFLYFLVWFQMFQLVSLQGSHRQTATRNFWTSASSSGSSEEMIGMGYGWDMADMPWNIMKHRETDNMRQHRHVWSLDMCLPFYSTNWRDITRFGQDGEQVPNLSSWQESTGKAGAQLEPRENASACFWRCSTDLNWITVASDLSPLEGWIWMDMDMV